MTQQTVPNPQDLQGQALHDSSGAEIGLIEGVYLDNATRRPEWAAVRLGPEAIALVPLEGASSAGNGAMVEYDLTTVLDAPFKLTALDNEVTEETEQALYRYYRGEDDGPAAGDVASTVKDEACEVASVARDEAVDVATTAKEEATEVASVAKETAGEVVATAKEEAAAVVDLAKAETAAVADVVSAEAGEMVDATRSELELQAETQLAQIAESLHRLAGQGLALARGNVEQAGPLGDLVARAGEELQTVAAGIDERGSAGLLRDVQRIVRQRPRAAIIGTAAAVVAGARLMGTPAGERLKTYVAPLKKQAVEAGRTVAEELKPIAQERAERVRTVAAQAADQVKQDAQGTVDDVKGTTKRSAKAVKGTAKRSATKVKGTTRQSTATVKRTARAAAPVG